ncbi:PrsW family intramembrane metalloprotease [Pseudoflavitalea sp. G-6-1-2]|uniref:PrsW family intramembrane metalloprotease n=1 Tax=Pseudoflavitalea sp. G-6-1-2 TaxID=2728841 RepID=UPI00146CE40C|nr:PrsW family glutamic-type intramembrane protease [Pseudoflavitalea sp. G-6-1-2]NML21811.1 PrsW family intramembrane metalloprotease [Pseudoflavitalea sp. G-6-1-2]
MVLSLLALALAPGLAIAFFIYTRDKYDREPLRNLAFSFLLGVVSTLPAILIQTSLQPVLDAWLSPYSVSYYVLLAFVLVAMSEEGSKFMMLRLYAYRQPAFDEPFDGIIYSVMVSMGFATFENIWYVLENGFATGVMRMFLSVPAHAAFGVLMGFHAGLAKFDKHKPVLRLLTGVLLAVVFHGAFDFFLFLQKNPNVTRYISTGMLAFGSLVCYWIAMRLAWRAIRIHQNLSKEVFENP